MFPFKEDLDTFASNKQFFSIQQKQHNVTKFVTEVTENLDLFGEISYFGEKLDDSDCLNLIKSKVKIPFQVKMDVTL